METKGKLVELTQTGLKFAVGVATHYIAEDSGLTGEAARMLGLSGHVTSGVFGMGSHLLGHSIYENWLKVREGITSETDLGRAMLKTYQLTIAQIRDDIVTELDLKESLSSIAFRKLLDLPNARNDIQTGIEQDFLNPILDFLTSDVKIAEILEKNEHLTYDDVLKRIIREAIPDWGHKNEVDVNDIEEQVTDLASKKFKKYFEHHFLKELHSETGVRTAYFKHLLESIILTSKDFEKDLVLIKDFATQANLDLIEILHHLQNLRNDCGQFKAILLNHQSQITDKIQAISEKLERHNSPSLDKTNSAGDLKPDKHGNKFDYKYQYLNFVGRTEEMSRLWNFIGEKDDTCKFRWWLITGPGGMGKSRIAQLLCLRLEGYYSGFLEIKSSNAFTNWEIWNPTVPTLIIIDYALSKVEKVAEIITTVKRRSKTYSHPVRLLLLDRKETEEWEKKNRIGTEIEDSLYRDKISPEDTKLALKPLSVGEQWEIILQIIKTENPDRIELVLDTKNNILEKLAELDKERRPLFTFLVGMALSKGDNVRDWNTFNLLDNTLKRLEDLWSRYIDQNEMDIYTRVLVVNTLCGKLDKKALAQLLAKIDPNTVYKQFIHNYEVITQQYESDRNAVWQGLQPDILGEFFVLKTIEKILIDEPVNGDEIVSKLIQFSREISYDNLFDFSQMLWEDFIYNKKTYNLFEELHRQVSKSQNVFERSLLSIIFSNSCHLTINKSDFTESKILSNWALDLNEANAMAWNNRGIAYTEENEHQLADSDFKNALDLTQDSSNIFYNYGRLKRNLKEYKEAMKLYSKAIELDPGIQKAYNDRGLLYFEMKLYEKGLFDLNKAIVLDPSDYKAYNNRGLVMHGLQRMKEAIQDYDTAIKLNPKFDLGYFNRCLVYYDLVEYELSLKDVNTALSFGMDTDYLMFRALIYLSLGRKKDARESLNSVIGLKYDEETYFIVNNQLNGIYPYKKSTVVTVIYTNGKKVEKKFKHVESDLAAGKCRLLR